MVVTVAVAGVIFVDGNTPTSTTTHRSDWVDYGPIVTFPRRRERHYNLQVLLQLGI